MDIVDKTTRSRMMSRIKNRDTKPELLVRSALHRAGFRFRLNQRIEGCHPDIVLPRFKTVIFVHGCFWHRHDGCRYTYTPKSRQNFWNTKFETNKQRDNQNTLALNKAGWRVSVVWECTTRNPVALERQIDKLFFKE